MQHPVEHLARFTRKLDELIEQHGDRLFVVFAFGCLVFLAWFLVRRRRRPPLRVLRTTVVLLPFNFTPRREPDEEREPPGP